MTEVTCTNCKTVHFAVTREYAEKQVAEFNEFYDNANAATRDSYGRRADIRTYLGCMFCGQRDFRLAVEGDCPDGCTITPVIWEE